MLSHGIFLLQYYYVECGSVHGIGQAGGEYPVPFKIPVVTTLIKVWENVMIVAEFLSEKMITRIAVDTPSAVRNGGLI